MPLSYTRPICLLPELDACPFRIAGHCCHGVRQPDGPCPLVAPSDEQWGAEEPLRSDCRLALALRPAAELAVRS
jgi:hypothetical protein